MNGNALTLMFAGIAGAGSPGLSALAWETAPTPRQSIVATAAPGSETAARIEIATPDAAVEHAPVVPAAAERRAVDLAIALDTSGSMEGLIDAARQKIWEIVNDLALAEPTPDLRVALLTYGNNGHDAEQGWVHLQTDFTTDLDLVSNVLFSLTTNGGEEYVGRVLDRARRELTWHPSDDALKLIIVAGNESADQDSVISFRDACRENISLGIMINSIYCGNPADNIAPGWREVASLSDGQFAAIDQNEGTIVISTPFDEDLAALSSAINETYVPWTAQGEWAKSNQAAQDSNAASMNSAAVAARAQTKGCGLYRCDWDLVEACQSEEFDLAAVEKKHLPEELQAMSAEELQQYLESKAAERAEIQGRITELGEQRQAYVIEQTKQQAIDPSQSLDFAVKRAIRAQATSKGFAFPESDAGVPPAEEGSSEETGS